MRLWLVLLAPAAVAGAIAACGDPSHVYEGRLFAEHRGCVGETTAVDVVEGDPPGNCEPKCLVQPHTDGGRAIYVSRMCGPYPFGFDLSGTDPACAAALGAYARNDQCLSDGGSSAPPPADASAD